MRLLVTGHAGFKGSWLVLYAHRLGHEVHGYGLSRSAGPSLYREARVRRFLASEAMADVLDIVALREAVRRVRPDMVLHLAARAIVKESFRDPVGTIEANVMGTTNVLEVLRAEQVPGVLVTTDKVYRNDGRAAPYGEDDRLGGLDPYGASKAACEVVADSYRHTYGVRCATARSGNVIGGGDWGPHRFVPACMEAYLREDRPTVYDAERPFLHVLDSVRGYLLLAAALAGSGDYATAYNFGPTGSYPLTDVAQRIATRMGGDFQRAGKPPGEAVHLSLDTSKAGAELCWAPLWDVEAAIDATVGWTMAREEGADMELVTMEQVEAHVGAAEERMAA